MAPKNPQKSQSEHWPVSFGLLAAVMCAGLAMILLTGCGGEKNAAEAPPVVEVAEVIRQDIPVYSEWVATLDGYVNATIRAQVTGYLIKQLYHGGDFVKKGQILFQIDPRPFQAALEAATGQLDHARARRNTAKANLARVRPLAAEGALSEKDLDDAIGADEATEAAVVTATAAREKAKLNLEWTSVASPVDGIAGIAKAQIGNLVGPGQVEELTTVSTIDPIKAYIAVSEYEYLRAVERRGAAARQTSSSRNIPLELILGDGSVWPYKGEFFAADREVDVRTGTIRVSALFKNPDNILRPGQFAWVRALMELRKAALVIPRRAVTQIQGTSIVAVVQADNKVAIRPIKAEIRSGQLLVVDEGVAEGEKVIAEGIQKVRDGMVVNPKPFVPVAQAKPEAAPKPEEKPAKR